MVIVWILAVLLLLTVLLCLARVGVTVFWEEHVSFTIRVGPLRIHIDPSHQDSKREKKPREQKKKKKEITGAELKKKLPKLTAEDLRDAFDTLLPVGLRALEQTRRAIRIQPLELCVYVGGTDPADTAELYGLLCAAMWTLMPHLETLLVIPDPSIHLELDLDSEKIHLQGRVGVSARIGKLLRVGICAGIPTLKWLTRLRAKLKDRKTTQTADQAA